MTSWAAALDDYEARLAAQRAALDAGEPGTIPPFAPQVGLGPIPPELRTRAERLLVDAKDLEQELGDNVLALGQDLAVVRRLEAATATAQHPHFVDFSA